MLNIIQSSSFSGVAAPALLGGYAEKLMVTDALS